MSLARSCTCLKLGSAIRDLRRNARRKQISKEWSASDDAQDGIEIFKRTKTGSRISLGAATTNVIIAGRAIRNQPLERKDGRLWWDTCPLNPTTSTGILAR